ncbi:MAG: radical SAM protein [Anaerolineales bacterium]|nr:radical SAM protein [Anaerolineales bacterium]
MKYVFGPIFSRRLGRSLGIDTIPLKTCNWNCIYCQLGRTVPLTHVRREYFPSVEILAEVEQVLAGSAPGAIDWVTFVGSGEPTLHSDLGGLIRGAKTLTGLPVAVITNGALLYRPDVRQELSAADAILPSLDAGSSDLYKQINRPWPEPTFAQYLEGLVAFREMYAGQLWLEVMLVKGMNDSLAALADIAAAAARIRPDQIHISLPIRPPAESGVEPADEEGLMRAQAILGELARVITPAHGELPIRADAELADFLLGVITRHPLREDEVTTLLRRWPADEIRAVFAKLERNGQARVVERYGIRFWGAASGKYSQRKESEHDS